MPSISRLLADAGADHPLAPYVAALLDSGLVVTVRDGAGRFEETSDVFARSLGDDDGLVALGQQFTQGQRFFDEAGRELPRVDHPAQIARRTGVAQRLRTLGVRTAAGVESWLRVSYMPVRQQAEGWEVMAVGAILDRSIFRPPTDGDTGRHFADTLLHLALRLSGRRLPPAALADALRDTVAEIAPAPVSVSLMLREGRTLYPYPITRYGNHPVVETVGMSDEAVERWERNATVYRPSLQPTDIVGDRVVVEYEDPVRTLALVPLWDADECVASFVVASPEAHALTAAQIEGLEQLGRLAGAALERPAPACA